MAPVPAPVPCAREFPAGYSAGRPPAGGPAPGPVHATGSGGLEPGFCGGHTRAREPVPTVGPVSLQPRQAPGSHTRSLPPQGLAEYCTLIDSSSSFRAYRAALSEVEPPCIPYL